MKNKSALHLLLTANVVSGFAQGISMIAIPWYFIDMLGKGSLFAMITAGITIVSLFWSLYAGTLIDRYLRKNIFLTINVIGFFILGSVAVSGFANGEIPIWLVAAVFCFTLLNFQIHYPNLYAFGQEITEKKNYGKTNSLIEIQGQATNMISGGFAVFLLVGVDEKTMEIFGLESLNLHIEPWALHEIFLLDACTYFVAFFIVIFIKYIPIKKLEVHTGTIITRIKTGLKFLLGNKPLLIFGTMPYAVFITVLVAAHLLLPMYVSNHLNKGAEIFAICEILFSLGALSAGIWVRKVFKNIHYTAGILVLMLITAAGVFLCAFTNNVLCFLLFSLAFGLANAGIRILRITFLFNHIPNNLIGRSGSIFNQFQIICRFGFLMLFSVPFFSYENNVVVAFFICGIFILASAIPLVAVYKKLVGMKELE
ncbi:MAG: MFS transporter permease [Flavobacteriales bacterium]|nr:MAG: MFS transporter permease [Flavobacteriales bacterium]